MRSRRVGRIRGVALACLAAGLVASGATGAAAVTVVDFDALAPFGDVALAPLPGVAASSALVLDEAGVVDLLGFPATGTWATSGDQGLLNSLAATITLSFDAPVRDVSLDVLGLPVGDGTFHGVRLRAWLGGALAFETLSDPTLLGDSGLHEQALAIPEKVVDRVELAPFLVETGCQEACELPGEATSFWLDTLVFSAVPEPGAGALLAAAALLRGLGPRGGRR